MKEIKDYLHLYLGCVGYGSSGCSLYLNGEVLHKALLGEVSFKPILRPLSSMTDDEADYFAWLCMDSQHHLDQDARVTQDEIQTELVKDDGGNLLDADVEVYIGVSVRCFEGAVVIKKDGSISIYDDTSETYESVDQVAFKVHYLLSKHFDLFGLIEAGLATDATTLKATA